MLAHTQGLMSESVCRATADQNPPPPQKKEVPSSPCVGVVHM